MAHWPLNTRPTRPGDFPRSASSTTAAIATASATPHTKGPYTQVIASLAHDVTHIALTVAGTGVAATITSALLDIAIGAAAAERVIIPNLPVGYLSQSRALGARDIIPCRIPAGTRVAVRAQAAVASETVTVFMDFLSGEGMAGTDGIGGIWTDFGTALATSRGVAVTTSATANTKGSWVEAVASTPHPVKGLHVGIQNNGVADVVTANVVVDVGFGAAGVEIVALPDVVFEANTTNDEFRPWCRYYPLGMSIPQGSRLAVRAARSVAAAVAYDTIVHGVC